MDQETGCVLEGSRRTGTRNAMEDAVQVVVMSIVCVIHEAEPQAKNS